MPIYNGILSTATSHFLTSQVDAARNCSTTLKDVILDGYGDKFSTTINGRIISIGTGMVSCGGRIGYLTQATDLETIPANRNVRVIAQINLTDATFKVITETVVGSFPVLVQNDIINSSVMGTYQVLLYSGTTNDTTLTLTRQLPIQSYTNQNHVFNLQQTLKSNDDYTENTIKPKFTATYSATNNNYTGFSEIEFRGNQYNVPEPTGTGNTLILKLTAVDGIISVSQYCQTMTAEQARYMFRSASVYLKNGATETLDIPIKFNGAEFVPQMEAKSEYGSWSSRDILPKPMPANHEAITYNSGTNTYTFAGTSIKMEFMGRTFWSGKPQVPTFVGRNLVFKFFLDTSTFSISADNDNLQDWAEKIRTAANRDATNYAISFPVCIDGIWQNTQFGTTLVLNEIIKFCSIPNNAVQQQTFDLTVGALNTGAQPATNKFCEGSFFDNSKVIMSCEWTRASHVMGTVGGTDNSTNTTIFACSPLHPARQKSVTKITLNDNNADFYNNGSAYSASTNEGRNETISAFVKTGVARTFTIKNVYNGGTIGVTAKIKGDLFNKLVLVGKGEI